MISRLDRLQGRDIYENTALAKLNEVIDAVNELQAQGAILEEHAHPTAKTPDYDDTDDIAEVKNENLYTKSMRMDKEFAEEEMERLQKELARTKKQLEAAKTLITEIKTVIVEQDLESQELEQKD